MAHQEGVTLIEMAIVSALLLTVLVATLSMFVSLQRSQAFVQARNETLAEMRLAMQNLSKEIRQAEAVGDGSTASRLELDTFILGDRRRIVYEVDGGELLRTDEASGSTRRIQPSVSEPNLFTYVPAVEDTKLVEISLFVTPAHLPETTLELVSEARLRNVPRAGL